MRGDRRAWWGGVVVCSLVGVVQAQPSTDAASPASTWETEPLDPLSEVSLDLDPSSRFRLHSSNHRWANDGTYAKPFGSSDKHYTNGVKLDLAWTPPEDWSAPGWWIDPLNGWDRFAVGVSFEQRIYTGEDITDPNPPEGDRPYAGYAALGLFMQRSNGTMHDHLGLDVGLVGDWAGGERVQRWVHKAFPAQDEPVGWGEQLSNEPTINLSFARTWKTVPPELDGFTFEFLPSVSVDLGNAFTRAAVDLTFRFGPSLPDDFGPGRLLGWRDATGSAWGTCGWDWYVYTRLGVRAVAWDITLNGNTVSDSRSVTPEPFVGELELGVRARYRNIEIGYHLDSLTNEFTTQDGPDSYGEFSVTIYF